MVKKSLVFSLMLISLALGSTQCQTGVKSQKATLTQISDWVSLFDGSSTDAWQSARAEGFPEQGWKVKGDVLTVLAKTDSTPGGKDIITKEQYSNFELDLEVKLTEGANSGIKYFVSNKLLGSEGHYLGLEFQLIDDQNHPDAKLGNNGNRTMASLYDLIPAASDKNTYPPGQWNKIKIVVDGDHVEHWLNGQKVLEMDRKSDAFRQLVALSKYKDFKNFGEIPEGHILLQGHSDEVSFREIKIRTW